MYLEVVVIDYLNVDGKLTNFNIRPRDLNSRVIIDSLSNVYRSRNDSIFLVGGTIIYNSNQCQIRKLESNLRSVVPVPSSDIISFQFSHMHLPVGSSDIAHSGIWNFLLPPRWRLRDIKVVNPYDKTSEIMSEKKEFIYNVYWDETSSTQMVEMELKSKHGSFSFEVIGTMSLIDTDEKEINYVQSDINNSAVEKLENIRIMDKKGQEVLSSHLAEKAKWLELKPNIAGIGLNVNAILESIDSFRNKITGRRR